MAFSFECPHCEMGFEAEFELCGSTCTCPGCGGLFLVPDVNPAALDPAPGQVRSLVRDSAAEAPGAEVFLELARLREELATVVAQKQEIEQRFLSDQAKGTKQTTLAAELKEAKAARKKADALAKDLNTELRELRERLAELEKTAHEYRLELENAGKQAREDRESDSGAAAQLKHERDAAEAESERLSGEIRRARQDAAQQAEGLRRELAAAEAARKDAEERIALHPGEIRKLESRLDEERKEAAASQKKLEMALEKEKAASLGFEEQARRARTAQEEAERLHRQEAVRLQEQVSEGRAKIQLLEGGQQMARASASRELETLQKLFDEQKRELGQSSLAATEAAKETERLRAELAGVKAEKWSAERGFAEEHQRLMDRVHSLEAERDTLREDARLVARAAAEPDGELERLREELLEARNAAVTAERALGVSRSQILDKQKTLEHAKGEADERAKGLLAEMVGLREQLEKTRKDLETKTNEAVRSGSLKSEVESELRQVLTRRDLEIQRLASELRNAVQSAAEAPSPHPVRDWFYGRGALALSVVALVVGLLGGALFSRPRTGAGVPGGVDAKGAQPTGSGASVVAQATAPLPVTSPPSSGDSASPAGAPAVPAGAETSGVPVGGGTLASTRAGMPSQLPDQFLGIRFGTELSEVPGISSWRETAGKRHRKAELLGSEVEAVLTADAQGRLIMGSYVRVAFRQPEALTPFLEWAVNVQDAVSALYGEPIRVHSVEGATDAAEVVRKVASGEDYYQATWEREPEDGMIDLSIRVFNERSVVFRMEYRARRLYQAHMEEQGTKDNALKDSAKIPDKSSDKDAGREGGSPASNTGKPE